VASDRILHSVEVTYLICRSPINSIPVKHFDIVGDPMMNTYSNWAVNVDNYVIEQCLKFWQLWQLCRHFDNNIEQ
jgi:hypothetical protein